MKLFFSCRKIILKKAASDFLHVGHPNLRGVSYIAQMAKCPQNCLVDMSFAWLFRVLNCQERFETASKRFSWTRRWTLKKIPSKKIIFSGRKSFSKKKFWKKNEILKIKNQTSKNQLFLEKSSKKHQKNFVFFWIFLENFENFDFSFFFRPEKFDVGCSKVSEIIINPSGTSRRYSKCGTCPKTRSERGDIADRSPNPRPSSEKKQNHQPRAQIK